MALLLASCGSQGGPSLEEEARSLDRSLICPVCPGETIDQAQVELARQMRAVVREKLAQGWSREQVLEFFVERYGEDVLAAPPKTGFNLIAWAVPPAAGLLALGTLVLVVRAMRRRGPPVSEQESSPQEGLEPYLDLVDRELARSRHATEGAQDRVRDG